MARRSDPLARLTDKELETRFVEAERNALVWAAIDVPGASKRGARWMAIAGELRAELRRRPGSAQPQSSI